MMNNLQLTSSIVVYKTSPDLLCEVIESFFRSAVAGRLIVVDNSPASDLRSVVTRSKAEYLFTGANLGFGRAHNMAIRRLLPESRYHLVLNPDVTFEPEVLDHLYDFMETNRNVGLVMPRVLYPDGREQHLCKHLPTPNDLLLRRFIPEVLKGLARKRLDRFECQHLDLEQSLSIPYLSGCFMFLRTDALRTAGLFDENIFMYLEDTDLTRRIHACFETVYYPYVSIVHQHARGSYSDPKMLLRHIAAALYYFSKWGWFFDRDAKRINNAVDTQVPGKFRPARRPEEADSKSATVT